MLDRSTRLTASPIHRFLLATLALAFACPDDGAIPSDGDGGGSAGATTDAASGGATSLGASSTSNPDSDPTAADSTGAPPADACACVVPNPSLESTCSPEVLAAWASGCPEAQPCPRLTVECPRPGVDLYDCTSELSFDETAMQCMLEALRDGTPGRFELDGDMHFGFSGTQPLYLVHLLEGRTAVRAGCMAITSVAVEPYEPDRHTLADPSHFTGCMAVQSPRERYDCMLEGLGEGTTLPECPG